MREELSNQRAHPLKSLERWLRSVKVRQCCVLNTTAALTGRRQQRDQLSGALGGGP